MVCLPVNVPNPNKHDTLKMGHRNSIERMVPEIDNVSR